MLPHHYPRLTFPFLNITAGLLALLASQLQAAPAVSQTYLTADATDTSTGSGFEADDTLKVELLSTTPDGVVVEILTHDSDLDNNGVINGGATPALDEFNHGQQAAAVKWTSSFIMVGEVPADATSVQLRISAAISGQPAVGSSEVFQFYNVSIADCADTDGDGTTDALEYVHGTSHTDAAAEFDLGLIISTANAITLHLDTDNYQPRSYQLLSSSDLVNWTRDGLPALVPGVSAGPWAPLQITRPNSPQRTFQKVLVQQPQVVIP